MIVHFDCPSPIASNDISHYQRIITHIRSLGHTVANDWDEAIYLEMAESMPDEDDWKLLCKKTLEALDKSSVVILEASNKGVFGIGYQAAIALGKGKPVLLLVREGSRYGSFVGGLEHDLLSRESFNDENIERIIDSFFNQESSPEKKC